MHTKTHSAPRSYQLIPIGRVSRQDGRTLLVLDPTYRKALKGLSDFSHLQILWWCHRTDDVASRERLVFDPPFDAPTLGIFGSRAPMRPHPIGLTTVRLLTVDPAEGILVVEGLDAEEGTPLIDLKPYLPLYDRVADPQVPNWASDWPEWIPEVN